MATTSTSTQQHREMATEEGPVAVAIVTVSDTRTPETDKNAAIFTPTTRRRGEQRRCLSNHQRRTRPSRCGIR